MNVNLRAALEGAKNCEAKVKQLKEEKRILIKASKGQVRASLYGTRAEKLQAPDRHAAILRRHDLIMKIELPQARQSLIDARNLLQKIEIELGIIGPDD